MSTNHTPTPWSKSQTPTIILAGAKGQILDTAYPGMTLNEAVNNRERIIACVNACGGISNEALEAGAVKELVEAARDTSWKAKQAPTGDGEFPIKAINIWHGNGHTFIDGIGKRGGAIRGGMMVPASTGKKLIRKLALQDPLVKRLVKRVMAVDAAPHPPSCECNESNPKFTGDNKCTCSIGELVRLVNKLHKGA